jgi:hypothetical protein
MVRNMPHAARVEIPETVSIQGNCDDISSRRNLCSGRTGEVRNLDGTSSPVDEPKDDDDDDDVGGGG